MIETVNSEQIESTKLLPGQGPPIPKEQMANIHEVPEDHSNKDKSGELELRASEPLNQPTFNFSDGPSAKTLTKRPTTSTAQKPTVNKPIKATTAGLHGASGAAARFAAKSNTPDSKPTEAAVVVNPEHTALKPTNQKPINTNRAASAKPAPKKITEPEQPKKKEAIPKFNLKPPAPPSEKISTQDLLNKMAKRAESASGIKPAESASVKPPTKPKQAEADPELKKHADETLEFNQFLKEMMRKTKEEIRQVELETQWKPKKPPEVSDNDVKRNLIQRNFVEVLKNHLDPLKLQEEEQRKKLIEEQKKKLEELRAQHGIKYPQAAKKKQEAPAEVKEVKPVLPPKDPIAEANNAFQ